MHIERTHTILMKIAEYQAICHDLEVENLEENNPMNSREERLLNVHEISGPILSPSFNESIIFDNC